MILKPFQILYLQLVIFFTCLISLIHESGSFMLSSHSVRIQWSASWCWRVQHTRSPSSRWCAPFRRANPAAADANLGRRAPPAPFRSGGSRCDPPGHSSDKGEKSKMVSRYISYLQTVFSLHTYICLWESNDIIFLPGFPGKKQVKRLPKRLRFKHQPKGVEWFGKMGL
jgi:hypothetical protein